MDKYLGRYSPYLYAILRFVAGAMFAMHGSQKLFGIPGNTPTVEVASLMGFAGIVELVGGVLIAVGFFTGYAAVLASGQMAAAYFKAHASQGSLPILNGGELSVLYCFLFLYIASRGAVAWGLDRRSGTWRR